MTTYEMCLKLQYSENQEVAERAKQIISGAITPEDALLEWQPGAFLRAVLLGHSDIALERADIFNKVALNRL